MKELTLVEKARAYDRAFRIAQELCNDPNSSNVGKGYVCTVFPELKESKDEKIRQALINIVKFYDFSESPYMLGISKEQVVAWLEKQGEQKPVGWSEEDEGRV